MARPGPRPTPAVERFWRHVDTSGDCWNWTGAIASGYGTFGLYPPKRMIGAHRMSWEIENGPVPDGLHVLHHCDNKICVKPAHLFVGTRQDNMDDAKSKGRFPTGADHYVNTRGRARDAHGRFGRDEEETR